MCTCPLSIWHEAKKYYFMKADVAPHWGFDLCWAKGHLWSISFSNVSSMWLWKKGWPLPSDVGLDVQGIAPVRDITYCADLCSAHVHCEFTMHSVILCVAQICAASQTWPLMLGQWFFKMCFGREILQNLLQSRLLCPNVFFFKECFGDGVHSLLFMKCLLLPLKSLATCFKCFGVVGSYVSNPWLKVSAWEILLGCKLNLKARPSVVLGTQLQ